MISGIYSKLYIIQAQYKHVMYSLQIRKCGEMQVLCLFVDCNVWIDK